MNKSIKKSLFITIILMNIFFFNTYKVNAKTEITECYYVLPNSNINIKQNKVRNSYASTSEFNNPTSEKRLYYSLKLTDNKSITGNNWSLNNDYLKQIYDIEFDFNDGCPKYLTIKQNKNNNLPVLTGNDKNSDNKYIEYIKSYYDTNIVKNGNYGFRIDGNLPDNTKYIPLYYYKTKSGGDNKCYLNSNLNSKQADYCKYEYSGINPISKYVDVTSQGYSNILSNVFNEFKTKCNISDLSQSERLSIYNSVVEKSKKQYTGYSGDECNKIQIDLSYLIHSAYYYSEAITSGGSGNSGFKSYKEYYNKLINNNKITNGNSSVEIDSGFLSLAKIISSNNGAAILDSYVLLDEQKKQATELSNVYEHICDYSSSDATQCYNAKNACRNGGSPTSENIRSCYINTQNAAQAQVGTCDSLLARCMEESQGITDATNALAKLNDERAKLNTEITKNENILNNAKKSISINEDQSNPLSMLNGSIDSSVNFECSDISFLRFIWLIMIIAAPILTIVFGVLDFTQAVMAGDEQKMNKLKSKFIKRLAALALFIILPIIIKTIVNISDNDSVRSIKMAKCIVNGED